MKFTLKELLAQKALLEKHLAWLDEKIRQWQAEEGADRSPEEVSADSTVSPPTPAETASGDLNVASPLPSGELSNEENVDTPEIPAEEEVLQEQFEEYHPPGSSALDAKQGCLFWSISLFVIFCLGVIGIVWLYSMDK